MKFLQETVETDGLKQVKVLKRTDKLEAGNVVQSSMVDRALSICKALGLISGTNK